MKVMRKNSSGPEVTDLQRRLKLLGYDLGSTGVDGILGPKTADAVKEFQQDRGLRASGVVDQETWQELVDAGYKIGDRLLYLKHPPFRGDDVRTLQYWLKSLGFYRFKENGIFCTHTQDAVIDFQKNINLSADGIVGDGTIKHLVRLKRIIEPKKTSNFPFNSKLELKKRQGTVNVAFDYGHDIYDEEIDRYFKEKIYICRSIVNYCRQLLEEVGIKSIVTVNDNNQSLFLADRINYANKAEPDIMVSINLSYSRDNMANGCSCYYFKGLRSYSVNGNQMANLIQDMIVKNLRIPDCRVHGSSYSILKETEMTSVLVEPGFISNPGQRDKLKKSDYQLQLSQHLVQGIISFIKN